MINAIYISDNRGETLELKLVDPYTNGISVQNIEGLGYPQTNISSSKLTSYDIGIYNYQEVDSRNIVLTLGMVGAPSVEGSRHLLYDYLPIRCPILLEISTDERVGLIEGYVETIEPNIFSSEESVQVSIVCLDPYFYTGGSTHNYVVSSDIPNFQFEKWFTDGAKPVEIMTNTIEKIINSKIQNPKGFQITIHAKSGSFDSLTISYDGGSITINNRRLTAYETEDKNFFKLYDDIIIRNDIESTEILLYRDGEYTNILSKIETEAEDGSTVVEYTGATVDGDFPQLMAGNNSFKVNSKGLIPIYGYAIPRLNGEITNDELNSYSVTTIPGHGQTSAVYVDIPYNYSEVILDFHWHNDETITARWTFGNAKDLGNQISYKDDKTGYHYTYAASDYNYQLYADRFVWNKGDTPPTTAPEPNGINVFSSTGPRDNTEAIVAFYILVKPKVGNNYRAVPTVEIFADMSPHKWATVTLDNRSQSMYPGYTFSNGWAYVTCLETETAAKTDPMLEGYEYTSANENIDLVIAYNDFYTAM